MTIAVTQARWTRCGGLRAGQRLGSRCPNQFVWRVTLPEVAVRRLRAGSGRAGQRLATFSRSLVEDLIRLWKPAHTAVVFSYTGGV